MKSIILFSLFILIITSCNYPNNKNGELVKNIHKVKKGMKFDEVMLIMGKQGSMKFYDDKDSNYYFGVDYGTPYQMASSTVYISFTKDSIVNFFTDGG